MNLKMETIEEKKYKVFKVFKHTGKKIILEYNLTIDQAKEIVNAFPDKQCSMVCFTEQ